MGASLACLRPVGKPPFSLGPGVAVLGQEPWTSNLCSIPRKQAGEACGCCCQLPGKVSTRCSERLICESGGGAAGSLRAADCRGLKPEGLVLSARAAQGSPTPCTFTCSPPPLPAASAKFASGLDLGQAHLGGSVNQTTLYPIGHLEPRSLLPSLS